MALGALQAQARLGTDTARIDILGAVDINPAACRDFEYLTGSPATVADVSAMTYEDCIRIFGPRCPDMVWLSPPCLPGREEVLTPQGPRRIETLRAGDLVLTHKGRYRKVRHVGTHLYEGAMYGLRLNGTVDVREFTAEHPMWVRRTRDSGPLGEAAFIPASEVQVGDRIGFPIIPEVEGTARRFVEQLGAAKDDGKGQGRVVDLLAMAERRSLWFLLGAYLGDGYRRESRHEVIYCVGPEDGELSQQVQTHLNDLGLGWNVDRSAGSTNVKVRVHAKHLCMLAGAFGDGCEEKQLPEALMELEQPLADALLEGYFAADGSEQPRRMQGHQELQAKRKIVSISLSLLRGMQRLLLRRGEYWCINVAARAGTATIEGREVQTKDRWELVLREGAQKRTIHEFIDGAVWVRVRTVETRQTAEQVWNLEVEEDNTFCVPMMGTHNCKGFSQLLPKKSAALEHYQKLNRLVFQSVELVCGAWGGDEGWEGLPGTLIIENVQGIKTRGAKLLMQVKQMLHRKGYLFHEEVYDCGAFSADPEATQGGPAHRPRYLLVARHPKKVSAFVHNPRKLPLRGCGDVLFKLPLPDDPDMGPMGQSPRLNIITLARLAAIRKGKDWRDLPRSAEDEPTAWDKTGRHNRHRLNLLAPPPGAGLASNKHLVLDPAKPARTVTGSTRPGSGAAAVVDDRAELLAISDHPGRFSDQLRVRDGAEPMGTVTGRTRPFSGAPVVADPRMELLGTTHRDSRFSDQYRVRDGAMPMGTVTGRTDIQEGAAAVSDPRPGLVGRLHITPTGKVLADEPAVELLQAAGMKDSRLELLTATRQGKRRGGQFQVRDTLLPFCTVTGQTEVQEGAPALSDPRAELLALGSAPRAGYAGVLGGEVPTPTINGSHDPLNQHALSDPRAELLGFEHEKFGDCMGVLDPEAPAPTVRGTSRVDNAPTALSDPRVAELLARATTSGPNLMAVLDPVHPALTVTGHASVSGSNSAAALSDSRLELIHPPQGCRNGFYGVMDPEHPASTITGWGDVCNGVAAVTDYRRGAFGRIILTFNQALTLVEKKWKYPKTELPPFIISPHDGEVHRALHTMELAALQGLPYMVKGKPLKLDGDSVTAWRERVGDAVPTWAAKAICTSLLAAHLASELGTWALSPTGYWVRRHDGYVQVELEEARA